MSAVKPKKYLGQHFLTDKNIALKIVEAMDLSHTPNVLEIGPGMGVLTKFMIDNKEMDLRVVEIDTESVDYLKENLKLTDEQVLSEDFLKSRLFESVEKVNIIGNFPYNISSQIFFKVLENRNKVPVVVGMIQKEVADRLSAKHGNKTYGILSVLLQAFYNIEYLFTVHENVFNPPPKVKSAVIRLVRNERKELDCDEKLFFRVIKATFNHRRKTIRNSIKVVLEGETMESEYFTQRPEQLSVEDFIALTKEVEQVLNK